MKAFQMQDAYEFKGKAKAYERTYRFYDEAGSLQWECDVFGACLSAPTEFRNDGDPGQSFRMTAKGKLLNATYFLDSSEGVRFATISRKGVGFRWKILGADNQEIARIVDPASNKEKVLTTLLAALPEGFAVIVDRQLVARIGKERLSEHMPLKPRNRFGKFIEKLIPPSAFTMTFEPGQEAAVDPRALIAGMLLLEVHDISGTLRN